MGIVSDPNYSLSVSHGGRRRALDAVAKAGENVPASQNWTLQVRRPWY